MTRNFTILCLVLGVFFAACKTETVNRKGRLKSGAKAAISDSCSQNLASTIGQTPSSQSSLNSLSIPSSAISGNANQINISASQLASLTLGTQSALGPSFIMWKVCDVKGSNCSNKGEFQKSYDFNVSNIPDLPKGIVEVTVKACVDSLQFIVPADQGRAVNQCTNAEPCFCGAETKTKYTNNDIGSNPSPKFVDAADRYQKDKLALLTTAQSYISQALACKDSTTTQAHLRQYTSNIAALSAAEMASYVESYGSLFAEIMRASQERGVDGQCALITDESGAPISSGALASDAGSIIPSPETDPAVATNETPATTGNEPAASNTTSGGRGTGSYVLMGLGSFAIIAGGVAAGAFGMVTVREGGSLANRGKSRLVSVLDKSRADRFVELQGAVTVLKYNIGVTNVQLRDAQVKDIFGRYTAARDEYFKDLDLISAKQQEFLNTNKLARAEMEKALKITQEILGKAEIAKASSDAKYKSATEAYLATTKKEDSGQDTTKYREAKKENERIINEYNQALENNRIATESADAYKTVDALNAKTTSKEIIKKIETEKNLWPEFNNAEDFVARAQSIGSAEHITFANGPDRVKNLRAILAEIHEPLAPDTKTKSVLADTSNPKARITQKQAGGGLAASLATVGAGVVATVVGAKMQLATDDPCSSFGTTIARMEDQLYKQSQTIQADLNALSALQR